MTVSEDEHLEGMGRHAAGLVEFQCFKAERQLQASGSGISSATGPRPSQTDSTSAATEKNDSGGWRLTETQLPQSHDLVLAERSQKLTNTVADQRAESLRKQTPSP